MIRFMLKMKSVKRMGGNGHPWTPTRQWGTYFCSTLPDCK